MIVFVLIAGVLAAALLQVRAVRGRPAHLGLGLGLLDVVSAGVLSSSGAGELGSALAGALVLTGLVVGTAACATAPQGQPVREPPHS